MKKSIAALFFSLSLTLGMGSALAEYTPEQMKSHQHEGGEAVGSMPADVKMHQSCPHCGMDRNKFAHSRILVTYSDGTSAGMCSIHCAVTELKTSKGKPAKTVEVADLNSKKLVDAEKAIWVIGGSRKGVMTRTPKWAFAKKEDAAAFIKKEGGKMATYKESLAMAEKD